MLDDDELKKEAGAASPLVCVMLFCRNRSNESQEGFFDALCRPETDDPAGQDWQPQPPTQRLYLRTL